VDVITVLAASSSSSKNAATDVFVVTPAKGEIARLRAQLIRAL
jgi:hypothetical protein